MTKTIIRNEEEITVVASLADTLADGARREIPLLMDWYENAISIIRRDGVPLVTRRLNFLLQQQANNMHVALYGSGGTPEDPRPYSPAQSAAYFEAQMNDLEEKYMDSTGGMSVLNMDRLTQDIRYDALSQSFLEATTWHAYLLARYRNAVKAWEELTGEVYKFVPYTAQEATPRNKDTKEAIRQKMLKYRHGTVEKGDVVRHDEDGVILNDHDEANAA